MRRILNTELSYSGATFNNHIR